MTVRRVAGATGTPDAVAKVVAKPRVRKRKPSGEGGKTAETGGPALIAVTGATGFLGAHIVASLAASGARLRILTHRQPPHPLWPNVPIEIVSGSITDAAVCARLAAGADTVVHAAGLVKARRDAAFSEINAQGTANLAQVVRDTGPACRFVLISSLAAREPLLSPYAESKWLGELAAQAAFSAMPGRLVILRPPAIYGPWDRETLALFKAVSGKIVPVFGSGRAAIMHVRDAANAIAQVALGAVAAGRYALAGPDFEAYTVAELIGAAAQAVGGNPRLVQISPRILLAAGTLWSWQAWLRRKAEIFFPPARPGNTCTRIGPWRQTKLCRSTSRNPRSRCMRDFRKPPIGTAPRVGSARARFNLAE